MNSILQVEAFTSTEEVQSMVDALQEIHLVVGKYVFLLKYPVEAAAIDRIISCTLYKFNAHFNDS